MFCHASVVSNHAADISVADYAAFDGYCLYRTEVFADKAYVIVVLCRHVKLFDRQAFHACVLSHRFEHGFDGRILVNRNAGQRVVTAVKLAVEVSDGHKTLSAEIDVRCKVHSLVCRVIRAARAGICKVVPTLHVGHRHFFRCLFIFGKEIPIVATVAIQMLGRE